MSKQQWIDLGVDERIVSSLMKRGINAPFPIQALTIPDALRGNDVCGKAKQVQEKHLLLVSQWYKTLIKPPA